MGLILITGAGGLVGSAATQYFHRLGYTIIGIDNDLRGELLHDPKASTQWNIDRLERSLPRFTNYAEDVRDKIALKKLFQN